MEKKTQSRKHISDFLAPLMMLLVLVVSSVLVIIFAALSYQKTINDASKDYYTKTSLAYVIKKIHRGNQGDISIGKIGDTEAVVISNEIKGNKYKTYLYQYDGYLREVFTPADTEVSETAGANVMELENMDIEYVSSNLLKITCTDESGNSTWGLVGLPDEN